MAQWPLVTPHQPHWEQHWPLGPLRPELGPQAPPGWLRGRLGQVGPGAGLGTMGLGPGPGATMGPALILTSTQLLNTSGVVMSLDQVQTLPLLPPLLQKLESSPDSQGMTHVLLVIQRLQMSMTLSKDQRKFIALFISRLEVGVARDKAAFHLDPVQCTDGDPGWISKAVAAT